MNGKVYNLDELKELYEQRYGKEKVIQILRYVKPFIDEYYKHMEKNAIKPQQIPKTAPKQPKKAKDDYPTLWEEIIRELGI